MHKKSSTALKCLSILNLWIMLALAFWQIQRAHTKYSLLSVKKNHLAHENQLKHQKIEERTSIDYHNRIDTKKYFIIEPAIFNHQVGKEIIAISFDPILKKAILINLGWVEKSTDSKTIIKKYQQKEKISGILYTPRGRLLQKHIQQNNWPKTIGFIDMKTIKSYIKTPMYEKIIITPHTQLYENLTQPNTLPLGIFRHICYALQFTSFGILGLYFNRKLNKGRNHGTTQ